MKKTASKLWFYAHGKSSNPWFRPMILRHCNSKPSGERPMDKGFPSEPSIQFYRYRYVKGLPPKKILLYMIYDVWYIITHANIWGILMVNVTIYGIHGSYGLWWSKKCGTLLLISIYIQFFYLCFLFHKVACRSPVLPGAPGQATSSVSVQGKGSSSPEVSVENPEVSSKSLDDLELILG